MKKIIAVLMAFLFVFAGTEAFALSGREAAELDLTTPCGYSAEELSAGLLGELSGFAENFIAAEEKYGVNALFLAAVAALESGWGRYCFRPNNIFGWSGKDFGSKEECIDFVASKIAEHYLSEKGKYYGGKTVSGVNKFYNGNKFWEEKIAGIMAMISRKTKSAEIG
ncbi:MAG: glucosaminidase domain-containing protein [Oscillospiraceae bacterium]|nr:glucosaminidase domain-containing protein [Oscillospiraceae bacterium]MBQ3501095.1 glucosaminidase domain-containing protein [Oscillospiraceae bacterium]MBQ4546269.1 glucosaminidase domain-containing protein [Oscillospiraceae bacterium]MBQ4643063.1 glucosaminidase domain-containing protein [Oscillospiraceae bacterium]